MTYPTFKSYLKERDNEIQKYATELNKSFEEANAIKDLEFSLTLPMVAMHVNGMDTIELEEYSYDIVTYLMSNFVILKDDEEYEIIEAEFYFYSDFHKDIITYERDMEGGRFFFHQSGVDITFQSNVEKSKNKIISSESSFGGILIRSLKHNKKDNSSNFILGPMNCIDCLWSNFNAINPTLSEYPYLKYKPIENINIVTDKRFIPIDEDKKEDKLKWLNSKFDNMHLSYNEFKHFLELKYRFIRADILPDSSILKQYSKRKPSPCPEVWLNNKRHE